MQTVNSLDEKSWRHFIQKHPNSNVFHTPEMFRVFTRAPGYQPSLWATVDDAGQALALLLPVQVTLKGGPLRYLTTRAVAYGSVLYDPSPVGKEALKLLLRNYVQEANTAALFTELRNLSDLSDAQSTLQKSGFVYEEHLNFLIDLSGSPEAVMQRIGRRTRKNLRRALRKEKVAIVQADQREQVAICYELLRQTYAAANVPLAERSLFEAAFDELHPSGMVKFLLARIGDAYAAGSVELVYKDTIYGWYGGMDRAYSKYIPNELLLWHLFEWGSENGYRVYDFGGAGSPDEEYGVRDFKAKFGGQLVCYGRNTHVHSPARLALSKVGYRLYRRISRWRLGQASGSE